MTTAPGNMLNRLDSTWLSALCMTAIEVYDPNDIIPVDDDTMIAVDLVETLSSSHRIRNTTDVMTIATEIEIENNSDSSTVHLDTIAMEVDSVNTRQDLDEVGNFLDYDKAIVDK